MFGRRALLALLVFFCTRIGFAQYGTAPNGYYPSGYSGDVFTGSVSAVDETTGQITVSFHAKKKTETFVGHLQKSCDVPSKDGQPMTALDLPIGTDVSVFFVTSVRKEENTVLKENAIIGIMFHSWDGHPVAQPSKKMYSCSTTPISTIGAVLDHLAPAASNHLDIRCLIHNLCFVLEAEATLRNHYKTSLVMVLLLSTAALAAKLPNAEKVLAEAEAKAGAENKNVMLVFESSWCPPCHQFDKFVNDQQIRRIVEQHFVLATIAVGEEMAGNASKNNPGSEELLVKLGGVHSGNTGVPLIFVIDPKGTIVVTSERPIAGQKTGENVGYPTEPEEIDWFLKMMQKGAPALSEKEAGTVEDWLRRNSEP